MEAVVEAVLIDVVARQIVSRRERHNIPQLRSRPSHVVVNRKASLPGILGDVEAHEQCHECQCFVQHFVEIFFFQQ